MKIQENFFTINITCDICGAVTGQVTLSDLQGFSAQTTEVEYKKITGLVDSRCDNCLNTHGNFKDMMAEYTKDIRNNPEEAEEFVKKNRKREDFEKEKKKKEDEKNILTANIDIIK